MRVFAVFEENNSAYIVEEFLHGHTLQHELDQNGALSMDAAMETLRPVCEAVETLHSAGLVHGDIKPINIMRTRNGRIVLLDFGLTASLPESQYATTLLAPQRGVGTSGYAPIEQYSKHGNLSPASDIYALSASLWQLITNQLPPDAPGRASGIALPDIRSLVPQIAENTARALQRGLAMNAQNRPQSVRDWWSEIADLVETPSEETSSTRTSEETSAAPSTPVFLAPQTHIYQQAQGFPWSLVFLSCSLFALLAVMMLWR